jgi:hypothetical protein
VQFLVALQCFEGFFKMFLNGCLPKNILSCRMSIKNFPVNFHVERYTIQHKSLHFYPIINNPQVYLKRCIVWTEVVLMLLYKKMWRFLAYNLQIFIALYLAYVIALYFAFYHFNKTLRFLTNVHKYFFMHHMFVAKKKMKFQFVNVMIMCSHP